MNRAATARHHGPALLAAVILALLGLFLPAATASADTRDEAPASVGAPADSAVSARPGSAAAVDAKPCAKAGRTAGWRGDQLVLAVAVSLAESDCTPGAASGNGPTSGCPNGSTDRGAWQINDCYHDEVSDSCAYDLQCNANESYRISEGGNDFTPWTTYNTGAYETYWSTAESAVNAPSGGGTYTVRTGTGDSYVNLRSGPGSGYSAVGQVEDAATVKLSCYSHGTSHEGPWGVSDLWDRLTNGRWVSDAFVYTGSAEPVVPAC